MNIVYFNGEVILLWYECCDINCFCDGISRAAGNIMYNFWYLECMHENYVETLWKWLCRILSWWSINIYVHLSVQVLQIPTSLCLCVTAQQWFALRESLTHLLLNLEMSSITCACFTLMKTQQKDTMWPSLR